MDNTERRALAEELQKADPKILAEIVRQAESFLGEQLKAGLAADQRSMTLAVILAAIIAALVGGTASLIAANVGVGPHVYAVTPMVLLLALALIFAVQAAKPTSFYYVGSNPKHWLSDVREKRPLHRSLAEQAAFYSQSISENIECLDTGHEWLRKALFTSMLAILSLVLGEFIIGLSWIAKHGLPPLA